jgi:uncharacterized membrane protein
MPTKKTAEPKVSKTSRDLDVELNKNIAALSYIWVLCLIPLLGKKNSEFAQFHAKQGLILFIASMLTWLPIVGWFLSMIILVVSIIGIIKTLSGEWWEIPYIYKWSEKIKL